MRERKNYATPIMICGALVYDLMLGRECAARGEEDERGAVLLTRWDKEVFGQWTASPGRYPGGFPAGDAVKWYHGGGEGGRTSRTVVCSVAQDGGTEGRRVSAGT